MRDMKFAYFLLSPARLIMEYTLCLLFSVGTINRHHLFVNLSEKMYYSRKRQSSFESKWESQASC